MRKRKISLSIFCIFLLALFLFGLNKKSEAAGLISVNNNSLNFIARTSGGYVRLFWPDLVWRWGTAEYGSATTPANQNVTVNNDSASVITVNVNTNKSWCKIKGPLNPIPVTSATISIPALNSANLTISLSSGALADPPPSDGKNTTSNPGYYNCQINIVDASNPSNYENISIQYKINPALIFETSQSYSYGITDLTEILGCGYVEEDNHGPIMMNVFWYRPVRSHGHVVSRSSTSNINETNEIVNVEEIESPGPWSYNPPNIDARENFFFWVKTVYDPISARLAGAPPSYYIDVNYDSSLSTTAYVGHIGILSPGACSAGLKIEPKPDSLSFSSQEGVAPASQQVELIYKSSIFQWNATTDQSWCHVTPSDNNLDENLIKPIISMDPIAIPGTYNCNVTFDDENISDSSGTYILPVSYTVEAIIADAEVDIKANGSDAQITIPYNTGAVISWSYNNAETCTIDPPGIISSYPVGAGNISTGNLVEDRTYTITCNPGNIFDSVPVLVDAENGFVTINKVGRGTVTSGEATPLINCANDCDNNYPVGSTVTLTAIPLPGRVFEGWTGPCTGSVNPCSFVVSGSTIVGALFSFPLFFFGEF